MKGPFMSALEKMAETDPKLMFLTGDLGFGMVEKFVEKAPKKFLNVGVAEQNMMGIAAGLAMEGHRVFTYSIANFGTLRCLEQIRNDVAYHDLNVNVVAMGGGFSYGALGISHHATEDLAIFRSLPSVTVVAPGCDWEAEQATHHLATDTRTGYLRLDKWSAGDTSRAGEKFVLGKARQLTQGEDLTVIASGGVLKNCLEASEQLAREGIHIRVVSLHTVKPLDGDMLIRAAKETGGVLTVEEHTIHGGVGGAVAEFLMESGVIPSRFGRLGLRAGFSSVVGSQGYLQTRYGLDTPAIFKKVKGMLRGPRPRPRPTVDLSQGEDQVRDRTI